jgi:hypothetical protein
MQEARRLANMMTADAIVSETGIRRLVSDECHDEMVTRISAALNAKDMARDIDEGRPVYVSAPD